MREYNVLILDGQKFVLCEELDFYFPADIDDLIYGDKEETTAKKYRPIKRVGVRNKKRIKRKIVPVKKKK